MVYRKRSIFSLFLLATFSALSVRLFFIENYRIISNSMEPTLLSGDLVFVMKSAFNIRFPFSTYEIVKFKRPVPGEVVAFILPDHGNETFVKRVVASSGDRVEIKNGRILINDKEVKYAISVLINDREGKHNVSKEPVGTGLALETLGTSQTHQVLLGKTPDYGPIDVPENHFFALGDNRLDSIDSRTWGPVPYSCLKGKVSLVWLKGQGSPERNYDRKEIWVN